MTTKNYSVDGIVNFRIKNSNGYIRKYFDTTKIQFDNFLSDGNPKYDFTVEIGSFAPKHKNCKVLDDNFHIAENYIYYQDKRKLARWSIRIDNLETSPEVTISTNLIGNITAPLNIIEFLIQYVLIKKNISIIHSSGVCKNGKCVLFPARSGGGKTTLALSLLDRGFSYLGDNYIILDKGIARKYISPLNIFTYNRLPIVERNLSSKQRLLMFSKNNFYTITGGYFKLFEKINPKSLFGDLIADKCPLSAMFLLEVDSDSTEGDFLMKKVKRQALIKKLRYNMELDLLSFNKCIFSYGYMFPNSTLSKFWTLYEDILEQNIPRDIKAFTIKAPIKWTESKVNTVLELINRNLL
jgi:hypothetical protein